MRIELKVTYAGTEPGLSEHRLSLSSFGKPLSLLLSALQRTASGIIAQAIDDPEYGSKGGKLAADAKLLDLELERIDGGSAAPTFVCSTRMPPMPFSGQIPMPLSILHNELAQTAVTRLLNDINTERSGRMCNASVRRYLAAIPPGVTSQRYAATRDGVSILDISFDSAALVQLPAELPRIIKTVGVVTGVGFEPGASFVTLKTAKSRTLKCSATSHQVDSALALRGSEVLAAILDGEKPNLIWIRSSSAPAQLPSLEDTARYANAEWRRTLEALAK